MKKLGIKWGEDFSPKDEREINRLFNDGIVFVYDWPTKIRSFYSMPKDNKTCYAYDALIGGIEILSGATRIHTPKLLEKQMRAKGLNPENFKYYIDAFRYGCPPHSGWSFGLERITMALLGLSNIREATLFPRDPKRLTP